MPPNDGSLVATTHEMRSAIDRHQARSAVTVQAVVAGLPIGLSAFAVALMASPFGAPTIVRPSLGGSRDCHALR